MGIMGSVGLGGKNQYGDIKQVQQLLQRNGFPQLSDDGHMGPKTIQAIKDFQSRFMARPDGLIDVNGTSYNNLVRGNVPGTVSPSAPAQPVNNTPGTGTLSGAGWVSKFQGRSDTASMSATFKANTDAFLAALQAAGAHVTVAATFRPPERAYMMHWSWKLSKGLVKAHDIPAKSGVNINWVHKNSSGQPDENLSMLAAKQMVSAFGMSGLNVAPALQSRHTEGNAIDMNISWQGVLNIRNKSGNIVSITSSPKDGMNTDLHAVGATYGVIKFRGGSKDKPHWSTDGR